MSSQQPLRTAVYAPPLQPDLSAWHEQVARCEAAGFSALTVSDHFSYGSMDPVAGLAALAAATSHIPLMALVFCNDYRHPVLLHKAAVTLDVLSGGRLDLGLGAGFLAQEYAVAGLPYDPPGVRVDRLIEGLAVVRALFAGDPVEHSGRHYRISGLTGNPPPVQRPHPPLVIGGGGRRVLGLAGQYADIAGIHSNLRRGTSYDAGVIEDMLPQRMQDKVAWVRAAADRAGRDPDALDHLYITWTARVVESARHVPAALQEVSARYGVGLRTARESLGLLVGTPEQCHEQLLERRERYGLNYVDFGAADVDMLAPLVARLGADEARR
jgi:probable F420-dependent oxidoreductase